MSNNQKVNIDAAGLHTLYQTSLQAGTSDRWPSLALEWAFQMQAAYSDLKKQLDELAGDNSAALLAYLRLQGLTVAVHNDYRLDGEAHTFWLMVDTNEMSYKGEGRTDLQALQRLEESWRTRNGITRRVVTPDEVPEGDERFEVKWMETLSQLAPVGKLNTIYSEKVSLRNFIWMDFAYVQFRLLPAVVKGTVLTTSNFFSKVSLIYPEIGAFPKEGKFNRTYFSEHDSQYWTWTSDGYMICLV